MPDAVHHLAISGALTAFMGDAKLTHDRPFG